MTRTISKQSAAGSESGFTIIELSVAMMVFTVVLVLLYPTYMTLIHGTITTDNRAAAATATRPALTTLVRQISEAGTVWSPCTPVSQTNSQPVSALGNTTSGALALPAPCQTITGGPDQSSGPSGFSLLLYLPASVSSSTATCSQWIVYPATSGSGDQLEYRSWSASSPPTTANFTAVPNVTLTNISLSPWQPPFVTEGSGGDFVIIDWRVRAGTTGKSYEIQTGVDAQGTQGAPPNTCTSPPKSSNS